MLAVRGAMPTLAPRPQLLPETVLLDLPVPRSDVSVVDTSRSLTPSVFTGSLATMGVSNIASLQSELGLQSS